MKRIYWRPQKVSNRVLAAIGALAVGGVALVQLAPQTRYATHYETKIHAAHLAQTAMDAVRQERLARGHEFSPSLDPAQSGLVGKQMSPVTSLAGSLQAKQTSVNPNFAAVAVDLLTQAGVKPGDTVAVGCTGSFPALNLNLFAALEAMRVRPIIIHSAASSQYGGNDPEFMWSDMERVLYERRLISFRSKVNTYGGPGDRPSALAEESRTAFEAALERSGLPTMIPDDLADSVERRMALYHEEAGDSPIVAYVNVGGGAASIRGSKGSEIYRPGLTAAAPATAAEVDCVMSRFALAGLPVIHLGEAKELAASYGLPLAPHEIPAAGEATMFAAAGPNRWLAALMLGAVLLSLRACVLTGQWHSLKERVHRMFSKNENSVQEGAPQWMV